MDDASLINGLLAKRHELVHLDTELRERIDVVRRKGCALRKMRTTRVY